MTPPDPLLCTLPRKALTCEAKNATHGGGNKCGQGSSQVPKSPGCPAAPWPWLCVALSLPLLQRFLTVWLQSTKSHPGAWLMVMNRKQVVPGQVQPPNKQKSISTKHLIEARIEARTLGFIIQSVYQIEDIIRMNL